MVFVLIALPIFGLVRWRYFRPIEETNYAVRLARERLTGQANEFISAIKLVRGYGQEQMATEQIGAASGDYSSKREEQMRLNQSLGYIMFTVVSGISIFAVALSGWLVIGDRLTLGAMVALVGALPICMQPVNLITQFSLQYLIGAESYRSIKELVDSGYVESWRGREWNREMRGQVEFDNVTFHYESEKTVQEAINRLARGRTTITIAHRLSTIRTADRIVVLRSGCKVAEGSWDELTAREGPFKDLLDAQA